MQKHRGKMKHVRFALLILVLSLAGAAEVSALPAFNFYAGFMNAWTNLNASNLDTMGHHLGWGIASDAVWNIEIPLKTNDSKDATVKTALLVLPGIRAQFIDMGASNWLDDGSRYRAWSAFGLGPELGIGFKVNNFIIKRPQTFQLSAAMLGNVANYTQTSLYNAYLSWLITPSWTLSLNKGWAASASLPLEYACRADGYSVIAGLDIGVHYAF